MLFRLDARPYSLRVPARATMALTTFIAAVSTAGCAARGARQLESPTHASPMHASAARVDVADGDVALPPGAPASPPALLARDGQGLAISPLVRNQLTHLMRRAMRERREPAACVASGGYRVRYSADSGRVEVDVWALTLANADSSDSVHVWYAGRACDDTLPLIHGHVVRNAWLDRPSPIDEEGVRGRRAAFNLLVYPDARDSVHLRLFWRRSR